MNILSGINYIIGIPPILSGLSEQIPISDLTHKKIEKQLLRNFIPYRGILVAMIVNI